MVEENFGSIVFCLLFLALTLLAVTISLEIIPAAFL
jgi:hypothetical protein